LTDFPEEKQKDWSWPNLFLGMMDPSSLRVN